MSQFALPIFAGLGGAGLNVLGALKNNRAQKEAALANQYAINNTLQQQRLQFIDQQNRLGNQSQLNLGTLYNAFAGRSGQSVINQAAQISQDASIDSSNLIQGMKAQEQAALAQKQGIARGAENNMQNAFLAGVTGGIQGGSLGLNLENSLNQLSTAQAASEFQNTLNARNLEISDIAKQAADLNLQSAQQNNAFSAWNFGRTQNRLGTNIFNTRPFFLP